EWDWNNGMEKQTKSVEIELGGEDTQEDIQIDNEQNINDEPIMNVAAPLRRSLRQITPP
ncbi:DUF4430 domain-containing protein, partial [Sesbania bispinosa]